MSLFGYCGTIRSGVYKEWKVVSNWLVILTYAIAGFEGSSLHGSILLSLFHNHGVMVGACWDNHCSVRVSAMDTLIIHNILGIVFPTMKKKISLNVLGVTLLV